MWVGNEQEYNVTEMVQGQLQSWVGRSEERQDVLALEQALRMAALFDLETPPVEGEELPPLWHWAYFAPHARQSSIDVDGHPVRGGFLPPVDLPRRMWAGSRVRFHNPLRIGERVTRRSEILSVEPKNGKQGRLVFVTVGHTLSNGSGIAIEEEQDIVYREPPSNAAAAPTPEGRRAEWSDTLTPDAVMLFRYSALTYNAHRIHYDVPYTKEVESYPGLVVHGPMTATLLLAACLRRTGGRASTFRFRGQSPLFADRALRLCGHTGEAVGAYDLWAEGEGGYTAMIAHATVENN